MAQSIKDHTDNILYVANALLNSDAMITDMGDEVADSFIWLLTSTCNNDEFNYKELTTISRIIRHLRAGIYVTSNDTMWIAVEHDIASTLFRLVGKPTPKIC